MQKVFVELRTVNNQVALVDVAAITAVIGINDGDSRVCVQLGALEDSLDVAHTPQGVAALVDQAEKAGQANAISGALETGMGILPEVLALVGQVRGLNQDPSQGPH